METTGEKRRSVDAVVVGAGTAGLQAALQLARVGLDVVVLEKRPEGKSGARWCNVTLAWQFERAGLKPPVAPESRDSNGQVHLLSPTRRHRFSVSDAPTKETDMRLLVDRLRNDAADAGVSFEWQCSEPQLEMSGVRPVAITYNRGGEFARIEAKLFVDASGLNAVLRSQVESFDDLCPVPYPDETCSARHINFEIASLDGAMEFLDHCDAQPGDSVDHLGLAGGYSVEVITVESDMAEVGVLVGTIGDGVHGDAASMMAKVRERHSWIGKPIFGGGGVIPLRRPYARLAAPGIALVGDAACQVMATHGSGIGFGVMAGKVLAEAVTGSSDPGGADVMWAYQASYHREFGAILLGYDIFRRYSSRVDSDGIEALFVAGLFDERLASPGLWQQMGTIPPRDLPGRVRSLIANPQVAAGLTPAIVRMQLARVLARMYPRTQNERALHRWDSWAQRISTESR